MSAGHGGARPNAGRKAGATTKRTREIADKATAEGITPLEYMLQVLRNDQAAPADRQWAAEKAAPYMHARLSAVELDADVKHEVGAELRELLSAINGTTGRIPNSR